MSTKVVWKYPVPFPGPDLFTIRMSEGAEVLTVQLQHGGPQIWVLADPSGPNMAEARHFRIAGTGHPISEEITKYVGTFQYAGGALIFHLFEVRS